MEESTSSRALWLWPTWKALSLDVVVAVAAAIPTYFEGRYAHPGLILGHDQAALAALLAAGLVLFRHRFPLVVTLAVIAAEAGARLDPALIVAMYTLASVSRSQRDRAVTIAVGVVASAVLTFAAWGSDLPSVAGQVALDVLLPVATGLYVATQRVLTDSLIQRTADMERERHLMAERARAEEQARIAREMHDVVAHRISLIVLHAGALEVDPDGTERTAEAARLIRSIGHQALQELRQMVGMLRVGNGDTDVPLAPQPTLDTLDQLIGASRAAGLDVMLHMEGRREGLDSQIERAIYRVVQEALTNVHKHAGRVRAEVRLVFGPDAVEVTVHNAGPRVRQAPPPGSGMGLLGLRERMALLGATFESGPAGDGGFQVHARIPRTPVTSHV